MTPFGMIRLGASRQLLQLRCTNHILTQQRFFPRESVVQLRSYCGMLLQDVLLGQDGSPRRMNW
jgi:hypothetical protein